MPEWRKDPIVERWVVISTERGKRPFDYKEIKEESKSGECPLCSGNEHKTPPEIIAYREHGTAKDHPGWWVRVIPNKFPAVKIEGEPFLKQQGLYQYMDGVGAHEVIIESASHEPGLDTQTDRQVEEVIWIWRERSLDLRKDTRLKYIQIFKNTGSSAGASLEHTHSQLVATPMVPAEVMQEIEGMSAYAFRNGTCPMCDILAQETAERERVVIEGVHFLSFCPYASRFPFEVWLVPKEHQPDFGQVRQEQVRDLAAVLRRTLLKMSLMIKNIPYNMVLHTAPVNTREERHYHWHLEILPRLTIMAGFELGTGFFINPTPPELAARALRENGRSFPLKKNNNGGASVCLIDH